MASFGMFKMYFIYLVSKSRIPSILILGWLVVWQRYCQLYPAVSVYCVYLPICHLSACCFPRDTKQPEV